MLSSILCAMILAGPCDGGQCRNAILPRHVVSVSVEAVVKAPVRAVAALAGAVRNREHKPVAKAVKAVLGRERRAARRTR